MKQTCCFLGAVALALLLGCAPREKTLADTFLEYELVTLEEYEELLKDFDSGTLNNAPAISFWLTLRRDPSPRRFYQFWPEVKSADEARKRARHMAEGMWVLGLANAEEYDALLVEIDSLRVYTRDDVLGWPSTYHWNRKVIGEDALVSLVFDWTLAGLVSEAKEAEFDSLVDQNSNHAARVLPGFLDRVVSFPNRGLDFRDRENVHQIFQSMMKLVPEANWTRFSYRLDTLKGASGDQMMATVEMTLDNHRYQDRIEIVAHPGSSSNPSLLDFPFKPDEFPRILNQFLIGRGSPDRVVAIQPHRRVREFLKNEETWFTRLSPEQFEQGFASKDRAWWVDGRVFEP